MIKSQRFYRYLLSYILLTVISLLIMSGVVYKQFLSTLRSEVEHSTINSLDQFRLAIDQRILEMDRMAMQISSNAQLKPFKATSHGYGPYEAIEELKQYLSTNMFISDIIIRYNGRNPEQLYAASGTYDVDLFFEDIFQFKNWDQYEFVKMSNTLNAPLMRPMDTVQYNHIVNERYATYSVPLIASSDTPYGVVMFLINESAFQKLATNVLGEYNGTLYVLDHQGTVLYEYTKGNHVSGLLNATLDTIRSHNGAWNITSLEHNKDHYTTVKHDSDRRGYSYVAVMPSDQIMHKVNQARLLFNLTAAVIFLVGVILAIALSVHNYKPLQKLIGVISNQNQAVQRSSGTSRAKDELDFISNAVVQMAKENEGLIHQLHRQAIVLRDQVLLSLITGKFKSREEWEDNLQFSSLRMDGPHFAVLLFLIDNYQTFRRDNSDSMQDHLKRSLIKILEELSEEGGRGFGVELIDGRSIVFLFNLYEGYDKDEVLHDFAMKTKQILQQYFRFTVTTGIGSIGNDITSISQSFIEASHAARYRLIKGEDQVIFYCDIEQDSARERWYPVETVEQLIRAIRQGDSKAVVEAVHKAFGQITEKKMPIDAAEFICFDIVNNSAKTLIELDIDLDEVTNEALERLFVPHLETIEELERLVTDICCNVCRFVASKKESKNVVLLHQLKDYIHDQYTNQSISLESIAKHFGISPSYATRFFKDHTGDSLMRYIDGMRMDQAKQLLTTTDLKLKDILDEVGYVDSTNFIRKFKKNEGVTPIQYRNIMNSDI
ncbi:helix-turn-helix domain-containing protein [Paenibacillus sp. N3/727]|uniref:helix-turn-helix domain-containing protein n=1 Tax=Paenibacillus sp. N3/727 TaxID=2925845 RepID=UPI001F52CD9E|nr:helix-turn-helix domain-containing protein [Paenibacillus sp. N3/727]UNK16431.1 helix-turn-helix domain-containing protein [Paenibacillus sp. N3/727]